MSNGERHTPENMTEGMPSAAVPTASLPARDEARIKELEVTTNGLSRDVGVLQEKMAHLATREDVAELRAETRESIAKLEVDIAKLEAKIAQVRAENRENFAETNARISQMETRILRMLFILSATMVATLIGAIVTVLTGII